MNPEPIHTRARLDLLRRLAVVSFVLLVAVAALIGVTHFAQAQSSSGALPVTMSPSVNIGTDNFDGGQVLNYWMLTGHPNGPRWNLVTASSLVTIAKPPGAEPFGPGAMWFGDPATAQYGGIGCDGCPVFSGTLTYSTPIPIPSAQKYIFLSFWSWEYTEMSALTGGFKGDCYAQVTCTYDVRRVWVTSSTLDTGWVLKWDTSSDPTIEQTWHQVLLNISEFKGQSIRMRFDFSTDPKPIRHDGRNNDARGWYIDEVRLDAIDTPFSMYLPLFRKNK